jgi:aminopeptidase N
VTTRGAGVNLRYLATELDEEELRRIFADTGDMLRFFGRRAGIRYRGTYTQVLVAKTIGQELAGFALMSEAYGRDVLEDATAEALIAHEVAHQWWGNMVTCRDWNHFWLNEGFASFMAAAYLQHRFGEEEYRKQVDGWRRRLDKLREAGTDRPMVFTRWVEPSADDRAVIYQKGAYILHLLRGELGERAFWGGIQAYTRAHYGRSVTTVDFQRAMERFSGRDLSTFFAHWVDGIALTHDATSR